VYLKLTSILFSEGIKNNKQYLCQLATKIANGGSMYAELLDLRNDKYLGYYYLELAILGHITKNIKKETNMLNEFVRLKNQELKRDASKNSECNKQ
jgi:hypothetical protein